MAKSSLIIDFSQSDNVPEERTSTRIRAFLSMSKPLDGIGLEGVADTYHEGRALIESLAVSCDAQQNVRWDAAQCATVLGYLHMIQPTDGHCFCNDGSRVNATCGFHAVLEFMEEQMWRIAASARRGKRAA